MLYDIWLDRCNRHPRTFAHEPIFTLFVAISAKAQTGTVSTHSFSINTLGASYGYEHALGKRFTLATHAGLITPTMGWGSSLGFHYSLNPSIGVMPRYYYNLEKRKNNGKSTELNSGNYLASDFTYVLKPVVSKNVEETAGLLINPHWGLRRVYGSLWFIELNTGLNWFITSSDVDLTPSVNFKFGILF